MPLQSAVSGGYSVKVVGQGCPSPSSAFIGWHSSHKPCGHCKRRGDNLITGFASNCAVITRAGCVSREREACMSISPTAGRDLSSHALPWWHQSQLCSVQFNPSSADVPGRLGTCCWSVQPQSWGRGHSNFSSWGMYKGSFAQSFLGPPLTFHCALGNTNWSVLLCVLL